MEERRRSSFLMHLPPLKASKDKEQIKKKTRSSDMHMPRYYDI
jgi:hypothetical protein